MAPVLPSFPVAPVLPSLPIGPVAPLPVAPVLPSFPVGPFAPVPPACHATHSFSQALKSSSLHGVHNQTLFFSDACPARGKVRVQTSLHERLPRPCPLLDSSKTKQDKRHHGHGAQNL